MPATIFARKSGSEALPPKPLAEVRQQGQFLSVKVRLSVPVPPKPGIRKAIYGFSKPSRLRFLKLISRIDWRAAGYSVFVTLTYPDECIERDYAKRSQDRYLFMRAMETRVGKKLACLWRVEFKQRRSGKNKGKVAAHMHLVILRCPFVDKSEIKAMWKAILGVTGPVITWVEGCETGRKSAIYASKYAAKQAVLGVLDNGSYRNMIGRAWGVTRPSLVPLCRERIIEDMDREQLGKAMWIAGRLLGREYLGSFFVFGKNAGKMFASIAGKPLKELDAESDRVLQSRDIVGEGRQRQ